MTQGSTPSRARGGPPSRPASARRAGREGPSASGSGSSERTPRTPRRATAASASASASAPPTSTRLRAQPITEVNSGSSRETSPMPLFTPRAPPRADRARRGGAPQSAIPVRPFCSESEDEEFPAALLDGSQAPTQTTLKGWKSPEKEAREREEVLKRSAARKARKEWKRKKELEGTPRCKSFVPPDDADVILISDSDEEPTLSPLKRKRPRKQDSPRKKARSASVISISCSEDAETPAPRPDVEDANDMLLPLGEEPPRAVPPGSDSSVAALRRHPSPPASISATDVNQRSNSPELHDINVDGMADMALDDPGALDQDMVMVGDESAAAEHLPESVDVTTTSIGEPPVSNEVAQSTTESTNAFEAVLWTQSQAEDARFFDEALASVARELQETVTSTPAPHDTTSTTHAAAFSEPSPTAAQSQAVPLRGPGVPSSPLPSPPSSVVVSSARQPTPPASEPVPSSNAGSSPLHQTIASPSSSGLQLPYRRTPFDGLGPIPWRSPFRLYANPERDASVPRRDRAPEMQNVAERGVINACDKCSTVSVPNRDPELEPQKRADQPRRDVSVPMRDPEPEPRKVANMGVANARDKFLTRHDASGSRLDPEPELDAEQATTATTYAGDADPPLPVSLANNSALDGNMNLQLERDVSVPMRDLEPPTVASAGILNAHESSTSQDVSALSSDPEPELKTAQGLTTVAPPPVSPINDSSLGGIPPNGSSVSLATAEVPPQDVSGPKPEPAHGTTTTRNHDGYSPPPVSPTSDSTLGGTPPIGTGVILPLALVAAGASFVKPVDMALSEDDEEEELELELMYPSSPTPGP
ncbi:hypothetical protein DFH08DRAFT_1072035 [Mycena albidolilacea]|uniref:Uncharacterized protein n=1 Tax=Mycena albidolilacea TaxID=1033008 RepID=A0AAD7F372_9AGAR|nr:hypothetical protein DFH08DRAFT_1072035 [Mycena albidolilacea]